jgi:hypothetical protein
MAGLVAADRARGAWLRNRWLLTIDGFEVDLPRSQVNAAEFGYAGTGEGRSAFFKARIVTLTECGTHAFLAAEIGTYDKGEKALAGMLYPRLQADELLTADRNFYSYPAWETAASTGAALLWRAPTQLELPVVRVLADGTYLTMLNNPKTHKRERRDRVTAAARAGQDIHPSDGQWARVIEYDVPDRAGNGDGEVITLLTTILDPADAHADELADAYHQRWEHETGNDQLKTHLRGPGRVLRSRLPELAYQEIWAWLITHHAITTLITRAATAAELDPDRISYTQTLRLIRRTATGTAAIPPSGLD